MIVQFNSFPVLTTARLQLRHVTIEDAAEILSIRSNDDVNKFINRNPSKTIEDAKTFIERITAACNTHETFYWGICLRDENKIIGTAMLWHFDPEKENAEIGYELIPEYWNKGIASEAVNAVIKFAFSQMKAKSLDAVVVSANDRSVSLLKKFKFRYLKSEEENVDVYRLTSDNTDN